VTDRHDDATYDALLRVATGPTTPAAAAPGSPFISAAEADQFLKEPALAIAPDLDGRYFEIAEAVRDGANWRERPVRVIDAHWNFFKSLGQDELHLERAARVEAVECRWRLGRRVEIASPGTPAPTLRPIIVRFH
jgi:hypothetical protein